MKISLCLLFFTSISLAETVLEKDATQLKVANQKDNKIQVNGKISYEGLSSSEDNEREIEYSNQELEMGIKYKLKNKDSLSLKTTIKHTDFGTDLLFPALGPDSIKDFTTNKTSISHNKKFVSKSKLSTSLSISSVNETPYKEAEDNTYSVNTMYTLPVSKSNFWLLGINYSFSENNDKNIPFPIISYSYNPSKNFNALIGLPLSLQYSPNSEFSITSKYTPPQSLKLKASYKIDQSNTGYISYMISNPQAFRPSQRFDKETFLFYNEKKYSAGVNSKITKSLFFDLNALYLYDREIWVEKDSDDETDVLGIRNEFRLQSSLALSF